MIDGVIVKIISNDYTVKTTEGLVICKARGLFREQKIKPLVGDNCTIDKKNHYVIAIKKRYNELNRPPVANIDYALIITSVKEPNLSLNLLDRLIINANNHQITPIICLSKVDLLDEQEKIELKRIVNYYEKINIIVVYNTDKKQILTMLKNKIVVVTGQTGAGKSTLLNTLGKNLNLKTAPISTALGRGKHTTRHVELFEIDDIMFVDTPGFSALNFENITLNDLKELFSEFTNYPCPYKNCQHDREQECMVKQAVKEGKILSSRYENYLKFKEELSK